MRTRSGKSWFSVFGDTRRFIAPTFLLRSREDAPALWLTIWGTVMTADRVYLRMEKNHLTRTGKRITPHMFRHACASFIADMAPERRRIAADPQS